MNSKDFDYTAYETALRGSFEMVKTEMVAIKTILDKHISTLNKSDTAKLVVDDIENELKGISVEELFTRDNVTTQYIVRPLKTFTGVFQFYEGKKVTCATYDLLASLLDKFKAIQVEEEKVKAYVRQIFVGQRSENKKGKHHRGGGPKIQLEYNECFLLFYIRFFIDGLNIVVSEDQEKLLVLYLYDEFVSSTKYNYDLTHQVAKLPSVEGLRPSEHNKNVSSGGKSYSRVKQFSIHPHNKSRPNRSLFHIRDSRMSRMTKPSTATIFFDRNKLFHALMANDTIVEVEKIVIKTIMGNLETDMEGYKQQMTNQMNDYCNGFQSFILYHGDETTKETQISIRTAELSKVLTQNNFFKMQTGWSGKKKGTKRRRGGRKRNKMTRKKKENGAVPPVPTNDECFAKN